jgi:hypothetical protein
MIRSPQITEELKRALPHPPYRTICSCFAFVRSVSPPSGRIVVRDTTNTTDDSIETNGCHHHLPVCYLSIHPHRGFKQIYDVGIQTVIKGCCMCFPHLTSLVIPPMVGLSDIGRGQPTSCYTPHPRSFSDSVQMEIVDIASTLTRYYSSPLALGRSQSITGRYRWKIMALHARNAEYHPKVCAVC